LSLLRARPMQQSVRNLPLLGIFLAAFAIGALESLGRADIAQGDKVVETVNQAAGQSAPGAATFEQRIRHKALELERERELATQENAALKIREKVIGLEAERRRVAAQELEQLRHKRESLEARVEYARKSVLHSFDIYGRGVIASPQSIPKRFQRSQRLREQMLYRLIQFRRESGGVIASGAGLNFFLELCGSSAFADTFYRSTKTGGKNNNDPEEAIFSRITDEYKLSPDVLRHIRYQRGLTGPRLSGRLNQDPLDVNWPNILKRTLSRKTEDIERRREQVLRELRDYRGVSPKAADGLIDAIRELQAAIHAEKESLMQEIRQKGSNVMAQADWRRYNNAEDHVRILLAGASRLIEAHVIDDVSLPPLDMNNGVTVEKLLAYMHENNLCFNAADLNGQNAYNTIFELMSRYYIDLTELKIDTDKREKRAEAIRVEEAQVKEVMLGNKLDNLQKTETTVAGIKAAAEIGKALIEARRSSEQGY
jgi:hypothetical protein